MPILGTTPDAIDLAEDRDRFSKLLKKLKLRQPENGIAYSGEQAKKIAKAASIPVAESRVMNRFAIQNKHPMAAPYVIKPVSEGSSFGVVIVKEGQSFPPQVVGSSEWKYGDTVMVEVSAKKRLNLDELMDMILLVADVQELKANPKAEASGIIIEAQLDPGRGPVATMLVQRGTLRVGDALVSGEAHGKVKAMADFRGRPLKEAGPSMPVQILGFNTVPTAGDFAEAVRDERIARQKAETRSARLRMEQMAKARAAATSLDDFFQRLKEGAVKELALVLKGDVAGSVEALEEALTEIQHPEVKVRVIHSGVGGINESDINLAAASRAVVIGFNVRPSSAAKSLAETEGVDIRTYRVIYKAIEDVQAALVGMLEPEHVESEIGSAEVRQLFRASKIGVIAGCYVLSGKLVRNAKVRVLRNDTVLYDGTIDSLKRFTEDVREVRQNFECGIKVQGFDSVAVGDRLQFYVMRRVEQE